MEKARPKLKIPLTTSDKVLEAFCWCGLAAIWVAVFFAFAQLPDTIPLHFNALGKADYLGTKTNIWLIPVFTSVLVAGLGLLGRYPHTFNYLEEITPQNPARNYKMGVRLMRYLRLFMIVLGAAVLTVTVRSAGQDQLVSQSNPAVITILILVMLLPVAILIYLARRSENNLTRK
ncbi:DUF1648 domain-containing protein [Adhaeribacter sp. BT258]|uniref:DUF1648 domain-containing protein n=1 Tax=Adhaeribacter terrigena TaxID=2793070 RepID=A0ABS1C5C9_9BACT|nr:DUF1648 domain-containing protein [Adhaeribacter terrigena]MBK0404513.1 DUF1648 domain-containing protein [Adhaeribacter terrigena]